MVEDEPGVLRLVMRILKRQGFEVLGAAGPQAAQPLLEQAVDLVLSDISMPDGGGRQVVLDAAALPEPVPVVLMSGYDPREPWIRGAVLKKPFTPAELFDFVQAGLRPT